MKRVYTSDNYMLTGHIKSLLEMNHIECFMKNEALTGGIGELPANECWPEIWIQNDSDETETINLIDSYINTSVQKSDWQCQCGETIEGQFTQCWNCAKEQL